MNAIAMSLSGLKAATEQFTAAAAQELRAVTPNAPQQQSARNIEPLTLSGADLAAGLVSQMQALANYRANIRALDAADQMTKTTINLIG
jgi:flagellar hook protein FlgE